MPPSKPKSKSTFKTVMLFGTFDMVHEGHLNLLAQARKLAGEKGEVIVSIARDVNVKRIKGKAPRNNEMHRRQLVKKTKLANKVILGALKNYFAKIKSLQPDIIALGYDQIAYVDALKKDLKRAGMETKVVRLKPYQSAKFKTSLLLK